MGGGGARWVVMSGEEEVFSQKRLDEAENKMKSRGDEKTRSRQFADTAVCGCEAWPGNPGICFGSNR